MADGRGSRKVLSKLFKGMPTIELTDEDRIVVHLELNESLSRKIVEQSSQGPISISLESLDLDMQQNQSFGLVAASTGCASNPGGPGC